MDTVAKSAMETTALRKWWRRAGVRCRGIEQIALKNNEVTFTQPVLAELT